AEQGRAGGAHGREGAADPLVEASAPRGRLRPARDSARADQARGRGDAADWVVVFSRRTAWDRTPNALAARVDELEALGRKLLDLTESNPTKVGLEYPPELLALPVAAAYEPDPHGLLSAREALVKHLAGRGVKATPERLFLTASTSEAYAFLFKLLCESGDEVFNEYGIGDDPTRVTDVAAFDWPALTFSLGGLSKSACLPQHKLSWILVSGPEALAREAIERLEVISDTYLSPGSAVQLALP